MNIKNEIENLLEKTLKELKIDFDGEINLDHPQDLKNGDWTTNLAMQLAGKVGKNPREFAEQIRAQLEQEKNENIEKIEVAGPGYLNFYLSKKFFKDFLKEQNLAEPNFAPKNKQKILLEHSSPNLFKPFHIGHLVNNSIGEALNRILKYQGNKVKQISFPSDVSPGIAKTIWALKEQDKEVENLSLQEIADAYVLGSAEYKKDDYTKNEIDKINFEIYAYLNGEKIENKNIDFYEKGKNLSLEHFKEITKILGSKFEDLIFESEAEKIGKEIVKKNIPEVFQESDGAVIFEGKNFTNVFINSAGFGTYLAKDIGLLKIKAQKYPEVQKSLVITDIEQKQHFEMVNEAGEKISEISEFSQKSKYLQHGRMTFAGNVKISSRYGNVPLAIDLIQKVKENILEKMKEDQFYGNRKEKEKIAEKIAIGSLKYSILKVTSGKNISFDIEKDTNPQGNSSPYILYSLVRAKSILRKVNFKENNFLEKENNISNLERKFYLFDEVLEKVINDFSPHHLANYIYDLAGEFGSFYEETIILDEENNDYFYNLMVVKKYKEIMEKGLDLLGIETVEKM